MTEANKSCEPLEDPSSNKSNGHNVLGAEEVQIPVPWGHIAGLWWGPKDVQPIICLHGWQDNAGTFDTIAPILSSNRALLAIELPGHGQSSHLPTGQYYYLFWDGIVNLRRVVAHYKWDKVKILGHSLGSAIGFLYAAAYPDEVDTLISLDNASPSTRDITKTADQTGLVLDRFLKYENLPDDKVPCYEYEEMIDVVEAGYQGSITRNSAKILMRRGMRHSSIAGRYYFSRDSRLKVSLMGMLSMDLILAYASKIKCSYLNIRAVPGIAYDNPEDYQKVLDKIRGSAKRFEYREVAGSHHVHLNEPEKVAPIIEEFLNA